MSDNILGNVNDLLKKLQEQQQPQAEEQQQVEEQPQVEEQAAEQQPQEEEEQQLELPVKEEQVQDHEEDNQEDVEQKEEELNEQEVKEEQIDEEVKEEPKEEKEQQEEDKGQEVKEEEDQKVKEEEDHEVKEDEDNQEVNEEEDQENQEVKEERSSSYEESLNGEEEEKEEVDQELLERQLNLIMEQDILNKQGFDTLTNEEKLYAIIKLINSKEDTSLPNVSINVRPPPPPGVVIGLNGRPRPDLNRAMSEEESEKYQQYLADEKNITSVQYFPPRSRLFIGNLPLKNVTKEDLFRIFYPYGKIMQVNIKNAFGFIQYDNAKSVEDAIAIESQEVNFNKQLILEVSSSTARPQFDHGDHGANSSSTFISSSKRSFNDVSNSPEDFNQQAKRSKRGKAVQCQMFVKRTADRAFATDVFNRFRYVTNLEVDMTFLKPRMDLKDMIEEAAESGVWGVILINKTNNLDISTFYRDHNNEIKYNEYIGVSIDNGIAIFNQLKQTNGATGPTTGVPPVGGPSTNYMMSPPPAAYNTGNNMPPASQQQQQQPTQPSPVQAGAPGAPPYGGFPPPNASQQVLPQGPQNTGTGTNTNPQQQQLLAQLQNLPPQMLSTLLASAQQQQQHGVPPVQGGGAPLDPAGLAQQPNLLGMLGGAPQQSPPPLPQQPPSDGNQNSATAKVQSLLDSLAKFQK